MDDIRKGTCPLCGHREVIVAFTAVVVDIDPSVSRPVQLGWHDPRLFESPGKLTTYACRRCGFAQLFVRDPDKVEIGAEFGTRLLTGPAPEGPYR
jgi:DNA-directed RNA polymerase subunit RPC12/RpoP